MQKITLKSSKLTFKFCLFQVKKIFGLEVTSTTKLDLAYNGFTKQVVTTRGDVVVFGKEGNCNGDIAFHLYTKTGDNFQKQCSMQRPCPHANSIKLLAVCIHEKDKIFVLCKCKKIRLFDLESKEYSVAYDAGNYSPKLLCHIDDQKIYVKDKSENTLLVLNRDGHTLGHPTGSVRLSHFIWSKLEDEQRMLYVPPPHKLVVISSYAIHCFVRAYSCDTGQNIWTFQDKKKGKAPYGLVYSSDPSSLLVGGCDKIIILDPKDGTHLQTIPCPGMGAIRDMDLQEDELIVHHVADMQHCISCFSVW